ncbi:hypothetical protein HNE_0608 [Hyphomonas neptunium ATCC 15444]|uniref:Uncharacterized protein n=2 Tax=Hyphomonas TaxID=85 RepID=Q0C4K6_HYPNA|nr:hypothetical protein HNE_0608 [Hyphomonas neptunium ATCC 15444]
MPILIPMSELPPPPEDETSPGALIRRASSLALGLIVLARAALARFDDASVPRRAAGLVLRKFILPAEAIVRRAILVLAATLPPVRPGAHAKPKGQGKPPPPPKSGAPRAPIFCLTEPLPRPAIRAAKAAPKVDEGPRISLLDWSAPAPALPPKIRPKADEAVHCARLLRRLAALENAYADILGQARRYLRRRAAAARSGAPSKAPLSFSRIPGNTRHLLQEFRFVLEDMNLAASETLAPAPNSS